MSKAQYPSDTQDRFIVRLPDGMRDKIAEAAKHHNRSMNAEIVSRLESSFDMATRPVPETGTEIPYVMRESIKYAAEEAGVSYQEMLLRVFAAGLHPTAPQVLYLPILPGATTKELRAAMEAAAGFAMPDAAIVSEMVGRTVAALMQQEAPASSEKPSTPQRRMNLKRNKL